LKKKYIYYFYLLFTYSNTALPLKYLIYIKAEPHDFVIIV